MISCDFAPNEQLDDAFLSLKLLFQPWRWHNGKELEKVKRYIFSQLLITNYGLRIFFFLTGRSALYHLLKVLNLPKNSEIIVQGFTCEAVVLPIVANNLRPIYADIETDSFSIDPIELERKIGPKTKAIILQHSFGMIPKHRQTIQTIAKERRLLLIEDIAHGFNPSTLITSNKSLITNDYYLMSFGRSKAISSVFGGAIVTNDKQIANKLKKIEENLVLPSSWFIFRTLLYKPMAYLIKQTYDAFIGKIVHQITKFFQILPPEITKKEKRGGYDHFFNRAHPNAFAILLLHQLKKFDQMQSQRAKICSIYQQQLSNFQLPVSKPVPSHRQPISNLSLPRYPLLVDNRDQLIEKARNRNVFLGQWYNQPVAPKGFDLARVGYKMNSCPVAEKINRRIINLPTLVKIKEAEKIIKILNDVTAII